MAGVHLLNADGTAVGSTARLAVETSAASGSVQAIIEVNQNISGGIDIGAGTVFGIEIPTGFEATVITFQAARSISGTYSNVFDDVGNEVQVAVAAETMVSVDIAALKLAPYRFIKIRAGTSASPTTCLAERVLYAISK